MNLYMYNGQTKYQEAKNFLLLQVIFYDIQDVCIYAKYLKFRGYDYLHFKQIFSLQNICLEQ